MDFQTAAWKNSVGESLTTSTCGVTTLLGGSGNIFNKWIVGSIPLSGYYNKLAFSFEWWGIDSWDDDSFILSYNGTNIYT